MRTKSILFLGIIAIVAGTITFTACKRDKTTDDLTEDTGYADDMARVEQNFEEVGSIADQAADLGNVALKGSPFMLSGCASVTKDSISVPHTITIDFGSSNCLCKDGRYRRGKIIVSYQGKYRDSGFVHSVSFDNYYVDDNHVFGSRQVTNMGHNSAGHLYYTIAINGHIVLNSTGDTISHTANRTRTWVAGENTAQVSDDEYSITGSGSITRANGKTFTINITSPLLMAASCNWIEAGTVQITPQGLPLRTLDYGNGNCDHFATVSVGNKTKTIVLH